MQLREEASSPPTVVVLDTNILVADFHWAKAAFRLLLAEADQGRVRLVIPQLVIQEAANATRSIGSQEKQRAVTRIERQSR